MRRFLRQRERERERERERKVYRFLVGAIRPARFNEEETQSLRNRSIETGLALRGSRNVTRRPIGTRGSRESRNKSRNVRQPSKPTADCCVFVPAFFIADRSRSLLPAARITIRLQARVPTKIANRKIEKALAASGNSVSPRIRGRGGETANEQMDTSGTRVRRKNLYSRESAEVRVSRGSFAVGKVLSREWNGGGEAGWHRVSRRVLPV